MRGAWLVFAIACHVDPPPAPPPTCDEVGAHVRTLVEAEMHKQLHKLDDTPVGTGEIYTRHCRREAWSPAVTTCFAFEITLDKGFCWWKLTGAQRGPFDQELWRYFHPVVTADDYKRVLADELDHLAALATGDDCARIASDVTAYYVNHERVLVSLHEFRNKFHSDARAKERELNAEQNHARWVGARTLGMCKPDIDEMVKSVVEPPAE